MPVTLVLYVTSGYSLLRAFSAWDYFHRPALILVYLSLRNPYRPTPREWLWSIPAKLFFTVSSPAIQIWSLLTITHDAWGTTMRSPKELSKQTSKLRLKIWEVGFFVLWIGLLGGAAGRYVAGILMLDSAQMTFCVFLGAVPVWAIFARWMVVAD